MSTEPKTIFVGLSGGVDSAVSAALLKKEGHRVVGAFIRTWQPDFVPCTWREERRDAMRVAIALGIPFVTIDAVDAYKHAVADQMIREYTAGRVPNPDVLCNKEVKFGVFLKMALEQGADLVATGHYAQREDREDGAHLLAGVDPGKDQSYFLWMLSQKQLSHTLFPVGGMTKKDVRSHALRMGLPVAEKKDSQGVCFLGPIDLPTFLKEMTTVAPGDVCDEEGKTIGRHEGALLFAIGQRHGFTLFHQDGAPRFVCAKNMSTNTIVVSTKPPRTEPGAVIRCSSVLWVAGPHEGPIDAVFRYHGPRVPGVLTGSTFTPTERIDGISPGQSVVFYQGNECCGGAIVEE